MGVGVGVGVSCGRCGGFLWLRVKQVLFLQLSVPKWRRVETSPPPNPPRTFRSLLIAFKEKSQPREPRAVRSDPASLPEVIHLGSMEQERERETPFSAVRHHCAPFPPPLAVG